MTDTYTDLPEDPSPEQPYSGDERGLEEAAAELGRRREAASRERPELPEEELEGDPELTKVQYIDGKDRSAGISAAQAAKDFQAYRQEQAKAVLEDLQLNWDAEQAEQGLPKQAFPETQEQEQAPKSEQEQLAEWYQGLEPAAQMQVQSAAQYQERAATADQFAAQYATALGNLAGRLSNISTEGFADIRSDADLQRLAQINPNRAREYCQLQRNLQKIQQEAHIVNQAVAQHQQQRYSQEHQAWAKQEDERVAALVPEISKTADPQLQRSMQKAALETLKSVGFSDEELQAAYHGTPLLLRSHKVQAVLALAARAHLQAQNRRDLDAKKVRNPGPVQRPGTARNVFDTGHVQRMEEKFSRSHSIDDAVRLMEARRAQR